MSEFSQLTSKAARVRYIKEMLKTNEKWALRGLLRIYEFQTEDEKRTESTHHLNNVGFNGADAVILTSFAKQVKRGRKMSEKQMPIIFRKMPKYARQLERLAQ